MPTTAAAATTTTTATTTPTTTSDRAAAPGTATTPPATTCNDDDSDEEVTTEEFELELDDRATWAMNFYECAAEGDVANLRQILDDDRVAVDDVDVDGFTALMIAAAEGHRDIVMELLARGADVAVRTHELRSTALHFAAKNGDAEVVEAICKQDPRHVDCWNINADTPLVWACIEGRVACVRVLLEHGADVNVVNQHGATTLICSVMIGEDPEEDESDDARAEIIKLLLAKNPKLVNFQDREGSTAMHLAASCGYLECVKTLLACGADITLRNAIGQTPLEEAEQTGLDESDVCVEYLRTIWQTLEEEAAARMMTMLEMEEQSAARSGRTGASAGGSNKPANGSAAAAGASSSSKKSKKKNKKLKRKAAKQQAQPATETPAASASGADARAGESKPVDPTDGASSGESSGDDGDDDNDGDASNADARAVATAVVTPVAESCEDAANQDDDDVAAVAGAWTTVRKKQHKAVVTPAADPLDDSANNAAAAARRTQRAPVQTSSSTSSSSDSGVALAHVPTPTFSSAPFVPTLFGSPLASARTQDRARTLAGFPTSWRASTAFASSAAVASSASRSLLWKQSHLQRFSGGSHRAAAEATDQWVSRLHAPSGHVANALRCLACGLCGDVASENVQCNVSVNGSGCAQLYCSACLSKTLAAAALTGAESLKCVKCHQLMARDEMRRNHFAHAQAAALAPSSSSGSGLLSSSSSSSSLHTDLLTVDEMRHTLEQSIPTAANVALHPFYLTPGSDLTVLSNGQLEVLEQAHQLALTQIMETRIANARAQERMQIEEWMKTQRDILHYTSVTSAAADAM